METDIHWSIKRWLVDVKSTLLDTEAKDVDELMDEMRACSNYGGSMFQWWLWIVNPSWWAVSIATISFIKAERGGVTQIASVVWSGWMVNNQQD